MNGKRVVLAVALLALAYRPARAAEGTEERLRDALRSTTAQLQALQDERAKWQAGQAAQEKRVAELQRQLAAASRQQPVARGDRADPELSRKVAELTEANGKLTATLAQCQGSGKEMEQARQAEAAATSAQLASCEEKGKRLASCEEKNEGMYRTAKEIIERYERHTGGEPFLGLGRVERENAAQDAEDKLLQDKVKP